MSSATLPEPTAAPPADSLYEVVDGEFVETPAMSAEAHWIAARLCFQLTRFVEEHTLGNVLPETLFVLDVDERLKRRPDVAFVSAERWPLDRRPPREGDWPVVPDLAIEVVSPNDVMTDVLAKVGEYFERGVRQVWVVVPAERQVYVYDSRHAVRIVAEPAALETPLVPGWQLPIATLFGPR